MNFSRLNDDWRARIKDHVARLVKFRTSSDALAVNDVEFIHVDLDNKKVVAWRRGNPRSGQVAVVVANFSDFATPTGRLRRVRRPQLAGHSARPNLAGGLPGPGRAPRVGRPRADLPAGRPRSTPSYSGRIPREGRRGTATHGRDCVRQAGIRQRGRRLLIVSVAPEASTDSATVAFSRLRAEPETRRLRRLTDVIRV